MGNIQITTEGVKKSLKSIKPLQAVCEYIWNGFDAGADRLEIEYTTNSLGMIDDILIKDNGCGIEKKSLPEKFTPFFDSQKNKKTINNKRESKIHGRNGVGRLTFFKFAERAEWTTVYDLGGEHYSYTISIDANNLEEYTTTEEEKVQEELGTVVNLKGIDTQQINEEEIRKYIVKEFSWYLELNIENEKCITINKKRIEHEQLIKQKSVSKISFKGSDIQYTMKHVVWKEKLANECSHYYFIKSDGEELFKETTSLNRKGDNFYHSVYIKSEIFNDFLLDMQNIQEPITGYNRASKEFKFAIEIADKELKNLRKPIIKEHSEKLIDELERSKAFPRYNKKNFLESIKRNELENVVREIYVIQPKIFSGLNVEQKKTMVRFLDLIMDSGEAEHIIDILNEVIELDSDEREGLAKLLKETKMSSIVKTIQLIRDRCKAIEELKELVFNKELNAKEVPHVQSFIERHYWIFGEQYHLVTAAEPDFEQALRGYLKHIGQGDEKVSIDHPDKQKEMDIFAVRQDVTNDKYTNIVVELKRPSVRLGYKELEQVKRYMNVIMNEARFNAPNVEWIFYLVGNKFDTSGCIEGEIENSRNHGEKSLAFKTNRYKIYVKTWSEVIAEVEMRHKFITEKLEIEKGRLAQQYENADELIIEGESNTAIM